MTERSPRRTVHHDGTEYMVRHQADACWIVRLPDRATWLLEGANVPPWTRESQQMELLQPPSWHPDVWSDITRMLTLNGAQSAKGKEMHLCPLQFDLVDRVLEQWSMPGELVYDPFAGLGTVPYRAVLKGRRGLGCELSTAYWLDSAAYCKAAELEASMPDLFGAIAAEDEGRAA